jgi:HipA-like protein
MWNVKYETVSVDLGALGIRHAEVPYLESESGVQIRKVGGLRRDGDNHNKLEYAREWKGQKLSLTFWSIQHNPTDDTPKNFQEVLLSSALDGAALMNEYDRVDALELLKEIMKDTREALMIWPNSLGDEQAKFLPSKKIVFDLSNWDRIGDFKAVKFEEAII